MTLFDYLILSVIALSIALSVMRGLVREVLALLSWVMAYGIAQSFYADLIPWLPAEIPGWRLKVFVAFVVILLATWLCMSVLTVRIHEVVKSAGLMPMDRLLGGFFGAARGVGFVLLLVLLGGMTHLPQTAFWREAALSASLEHAATRVRAQLPAGIADTIRFTVPEPHGS